MDATPPPEDQEQEHADAAWLAEGKPEESAPAAAPADAPPAGDEGYDVVGVGPGEAGADSPDAVATPIPVAPRPAGPKEAETATRRAKAEPATVDVVWSRWGEWGFDLLRLGAAGLLALFLLYVTLSWGLYSLAFFVALAALAGMALLSYPLAITLERPVRVTPEQAVRDFYGALSHSVPHYRRMWLLLSSAGRRGPEFSSFAGFRAYWAATLAALDEGVPSRFNPLRFEVEEFRSEKSHGLTAIVGKLTLKVTHRRASGRPPRTFRSEIGLVKGPDRMWYLNRGTMPPA